jgi:uncharacterized membrane protein YhaH (DUF805 family)
MQWYLGVLQKYADFTGRARRKEYWMFLLIHIIIIVVLATLAGIGSAAGGRNGPNPLGGLFGAIYGLYVLALLIPSLAVLVRRLHDTGRSGWWWLISFVPFVGGIILLIFTVEDGQRGDNQYGPNPKGDSGQSFPSAEPLPGA